MRLTPASARISTNCSATVFAIGALHVIQCSLCNLARCLPHSTPDLGSIVTPFFTAPAVVLTVLAPYRVRNQIPSCPAAYRAQPRVPCAAHAEIRTSDGWHFGRGQSHERMRLCTP